MNNPTNRDAGVAELWHADVDRLVSESEKENPCDGNKPLIQQPTLDQIKGMDDTILGLTPVSSGVGQEREYRGHVNRNPVITASK